MIEIVLVNLEINQAIYLTRISIEMETCNPAEIKKGTWNLTYVCI